MNHFTDRISQITGQLRFDVEHIIDTAPVRYKVYQIPKRDRSMRTIAHPSRELKVIQRAIIKLIYNDLPVHSAATAYEKNRSIVVNANYHKGARWIAKFDITNFFNSITTEDWIRFLSDVKADKEVSDVTSKALFWKPNRKNIACLSVGAPSSPFASNRFMYRFDESMYNFCKKNEYIFTRYADDITVSSGSDPVEIEMVREYIMRSFPYEDQFEINEKKTLLAGPGQRRSITGIVLANSGKISLGRSKRRKIEAMAHALSIGKNKTKRSVILGNLAFLKMVDPIAFERIIAKFPLTKKDD